MGTKYRDAAGVLRERVEAVVKGSNLADLIPITVAAEPEFTPYVLLYVAEVGIVHVLTSSGEDRTYPSGALPVGPTSLQVTKVYDDTTATVLAGIPSA